MRPGTSGEEFGIVAFPSFSLESSSLLRYPPDAAAFSLIPLNADPSPSEGNAGDWLLLELVGDACEANAFLPIVIAMTQCTERNPRG